MPRFGHLRLTLATWDARLHRAAQSQGLALFPTDLPWATPTAHLLAGAEACNSPARPKGDDRRRSSFRGSSAPSGRRRRRNARFNIPPA